MKYTLTDRLMWHFMQGTCYKVLRAECPEWDYHQLRKAAKNRFREILTSTPSIGSYRENSLKKNLVGGMVWFAIYETSKTDYITFEAMGAILHRNKTLASGDDCCLYYMTKHGSEAEQRWLDEHPDGTFINK